METDFDPMDNDFEVDTNAEGIDNLIEDDIYDIQKADVESDYANLVDPDSTPDDTERGARSRLDEYAGWEY